MSELSQAKDSQEQERFDAWLRSWRSPLWVAVQIVSLAVAGWIGSGHHWRDGALYGGGLTVVVLTDLFGSRHVRVRSEAEAR